MEHTVKNQMVLVVLAAIRAISTGFVVLGFIAVGKLIVHVTNSRLIAAVVSLFTNSKLVTSRP